MMKLVLLSCLVAAAYCTICVPSDFTAFEGCMNETLPHHGPEDVKACFIKNNCPVPEMKPHNETESGESGESGEEDDEEDDDKHAFGWSKGSSSKGFSGKGSSGKGSWGKDKGKGKEGSFSMPAEFEDVNKTLLRDCAEELRKTATNDIKSCVQTKYNAAFDFPDFKGMGKGKGKGHHHFKGHGKGKGKGGEHHFNKTECANEKEVKTCIGGLFNESAVCDAVHTCEVKSACNKTETENAVCDCAKSTVEAKGAAYEEKLFQCLGKEKPSKSKMFKMMQEKATGMFCRRHEMPMCGQGKGKGKGGRSVKAKKVAKGLANRFEKSN